MQYMQIFITVLTIVLGFLSVITYIKKDEQRITSLEIKLQDTRDTVDNLQESILEMKKDLTKLLVNTEKIKTYIEKDGK